MRSATDRLFLVRQLGQQRVDLLLQVGDLAGVGRRAAEARVEPIALLLQLGGADLRLVALLRHSRCELRHALVERGLGRLDLRQCLRGLGDVGACRLELGARGLELASQRLELSLGPTGERLVLALHLLDLALELADPGLRLFTFLLVLRSELMELLLERIAGRRRLRELLGPALERVERGLALGVELRRPAALGLGQLLQTLPELAPVLLEVRRARGARLAIAGQGLARLEQVAFERAALRDDRGELGCAQPDLALRLFELELEPRHAILELARGLGLLLAQPVGLLAQLFDPRARLIALLLQALLRLLQTLLRAVALAGDRGQIFRALLEVDTQRVEILLAPRLAVARLLEPLLYFLDPLLALAQVEHHLPALTLLEAQSLLRLRQALLERLEAALRGARRLPQRDHLLAPVLPHGVDALQQRRLLVVERLQDRGLAQTAVVGRAGGIVAVAAVGRDCWRRFLRGDRLPRRRAERVRLERPHAAREVVGSETIGRKGRRRPELRQVRIEIRAVGLHYQQHGRGYALSA